MLFKYMEAQHADTFFRDGSLRIGTLFHYRDEERFGSEIGDTQEGVKTLRTVVRNLKYTGSSKVPSYITNAIRAEGGAVVTLENCVFEDHQQSPNLYIFCLSSEYSSEAMAKMKKEVCVRIRDMRALVEAVGKRLPSGSRFQGLHTCHYVERVVKHEDDHGITPALIKEPRYAYQKEVRAIWAPRNLDRIEFLDLRCPEIRHLCDVYPAPLGASYA